MSKVSILTPSYNDASFVVHMIESVLRNKYDNWELIIVNDASMDDTEEKIKPFLNDERIRYLKNEYNMDQLCSLYKAAQHATGEMLMLLHSDDELTDDALNLIADTFARESDIEGIYGDLILVGKQGRTLGYLRTPQRVDERTILSVFAGLGANFVTDFFCVRKNTFFSQVISNYVLWNTPYWIDWYKKSVIRLKKVKPWYKYRQGDNYLQVGSKEERIAFVMQGCYRTLIELAPFVHLRGISLLRLLYKIPKVRGAAYRFPHFFTSLRTRFSLENLYRSLFATSFLLEELFHRHKLQNPKLKKFFDKPIKVIRNINWAGVIDFEISMLGKKYLGMDGQKFFEDVTSGNSDVRPYWQIIETIENLQPLRVPKEEDLRDLKEALKFLCLPLPILVGDEKPSLENILRGFIRRFAP